MAWKWYDITSYQVAVGGAGNYYGSVQLFGEDFYALLTFHKGDSLPDATTPTTFGQRFYGHMDVQQLSPMVDLLRHESPLRFGWNEADPNSFHLMTGAEPVGEGDGLLA
jgi:hypothetical protein